MNQQSNAERLSAIEVRVTDLSQLFDTLDPFPFPDRDLDRDAEEFIVGWARELPRNHPLDIVIHMPESALAKHDKDTVQDAMRRFFTYRAEIVGRDLNELFRVGRVALAIGLVVLAAALALTQAISGALDPSPLGKFFEESLIIVAWVANWRPIEIFLYDWWPLVRRRNLYRRLSQANIRFQPEVKTS